MADPPPLKSGSETPPKLQRVAGILGIITLVFALVSIAQLHFRFGSEFSLQLLLPLLTSLLALAALTAGLAEFLLSPHSRKHWTIFGMTSGGLSLIILAVGIVFVQFGRLKARLDQPQYKQTTRVIELDPIVVPDESITVREFKDSWLAFLTVHVANPTKEQFKGKKSETLVGAIIDGYCREISNQDNKPTKKEWNLLTAELINNSQHGSSTCVLLTAGYNERSNNVITMSSTIRNFRKNETNPFLHLVVELQRADMMGRIGSHQQKRDSQQRALKALDELLGQGWFDESSEWLLVELTHVPYFGELEEENADKVLEIFESHQLPPWFLHYARGDYLVSKAWEARGSGTAGTVSDEGWIGFSEYLNQATKELTASWELAPEYPFAASRMITVAMGNADDEVTEMRKWFDRATAASGDIYSAYDKFYWGMRPRWHGTHEAILQFAEHALATGRFDTEVPMQYLYGVKTIGRDDDWEEGNIYSRDGVYENISRMVDGYLNHGVTPERERFLRSTRAMIAYQQQHHDDLRRDWLALDGKLSREVVNSWTHDPSLLRFRSHLGLGNETVQAARDLELNLDFSAAASEYRKAAVEPDWTERQRAFLEAHAEVCELRHLYEKGEWIELIHDDRRELWLPVEGSFSRDEEENIVVQTNSSRFAIEHPMKLGSEFEAKVTFLSPDEMLHQGGSGVHFSYSTFDAKRWHTVYLKALHDYSRKYYSSRHRYAAYFSAETSKAAETTLHVTCRDDQWQVSANGKKLHYGDIELDPSYIGTGTRLCLGGWPCQDVDNFALTYVSVKVRKLDPIEKAE